MPDQYESAVAPRQDATSFVDPWRTSGGEREFLGIVRRYCRLVRAPEPTHFDDQMKATLHNSLVALDFSAGEDVAHRVHHAARRVAEGRKAREFYADRARRFAEGTPALLADLPDSCRRNDESAVEQRQPLSRNPFFAAYADARLRYR
tara:strand:+ start:4169 stop:4612 length:444 start_codon:yes stop_codon:yes gene_type:complete